MTPGIPVPTFAILLGDNLFIGTNGVIRTIEPSGPFEFFRLREIDRPRFGGSYIGVDCDIKDAEGAREVKLAKSRPIRQILPPGIEAKCEPGFTEVVRSDGAVIIKIEELAVGHPALTGRLQSAVGLVGIVQITGDFRAGPFRIQASPEGVILDGPGVVNFRISRNTNIGGGAITVGPGYLAM